MQSPPYYNVYSWIYGDYSEQANATEIALVRKKLNATIKKIHPFSKLLWTRATEYCSHVSSQALRDGFYKDFKGIQGNGRVYYGTTLIDGVEHE